MPTGQLPHRTVAEGIASELVPQNPRCNVDTGHYSIEGPEVQPLDTIRERLTVIFGQFDRLRYSFCETTVKRSCKEWRVACEQFLWQNPR